MRTLLDFIVRHSYIFLFLLLEIISLLLLFGFNDRQKAALFSSANSVSGFVFETNSNVKEYFVLRSENSKLAQENARLHSQLFALRDTLRLREEESMQTDVIVARVVDNSVRKDDNYITINRGSSDGITEGMGVYNSDGVIGIVIIVGRHYSVVLPILNSRSSISCRINGQNCFGFLEWKGGDPYKAELVDLPYLTDVKVGDSIVTSGFSSVFPDGIPVGVVCGSEEYQAGYSIVVQVRLAADISNLNYVYVNARRKDSDLLMLNQNLE